MTETVEFSSPAALASYLYSRAERHATTPWQRVLLAVVAAERAAELWERYSEEQ